MAQFSSIQRVKEIAGQRHLFKGLSPERIFVLGFALLILIGTILLAMPISSASGKPTSMINAFFTATSAVCVTGMVVVDTGTYFSTFGQIVILLLIQIGGLGFMTMGTLFAFIMGKRIRLRERLLIQESLNQITIQGVVRLARWILLFTFIIEGTAALILAVKWIPELGLFKGIYISFFHSVSAFNSAGFDIFGAYKSLMPYVSDVTINLVTSVLILLGGIGFTVIVEVVSKKRWRKFSLHTKVVLAATAVLLVSGTAGIFMLEYNNPATLGALDLKDKFLASWFQSVSTRSAGYNTLDLSALKNATHFLIIILMFIGASPNSTGGGIKTTTAGALLAAVWSTIRGKQDVEMFERRIPHEIVYRALTVTLASLTLVAFVTMLLSVTEASDFLTNMFEATSAFATAGMTTGLTTKLSVTGKLIISMTMFAGRLGPLTIAFAMAQKQSKAVYHYAEEKIIVG